MTTALEQHLLICAYEVLVKLQGMPVKIMDRDGEYDPPVEIINNARLVIDLGEFLGELAPAMESAMVQRLALAVPIWMGTSDAISLDRVAACILDKRAASV